MKHTYKHTKAHVFSFTQLLARAAVAVGLTLCLGSSDAMAASPVDTPPAGFKTTYLFPGVRASGPASDSDLATAVLCTNIDKNKSATVRVEFFHSFHVLAGASGAVLAPGEAGIWTTREVIFFWGEHSAELGTTAIDNGTGRILTAGTKKLICTAQTFKDDLHPLHLTSLPIYTPSARMP